MKLPLFHNEILKIKPYKPGTSRLEGVANPIKLSSNENPFGPSPLALKAIEKAMHKAHRYPDGNSTEVKAAIAARYQLEESRIVCSAGSDELIALLCQAYAGPGTEVLYSQYGFLMYPISALRVGATPVVAAEENLTASIKNLLAAVTPKTRLLFIANPNNPTGSYLSEKDIRALRKQLPAHVLLVLDNAYAEYVTEKDYSHCHRLVEETENTVALHTFSKIYGIASLRLGWGYFPPEVADIMHRVRGPFNVSDVAQVAGVASLKDVEYTEKAVRHNTEQRAWMARTLAGLGLTVHPSVANFLLVEFPKSKRHDAAAADSFLHTRGIIVRSMVSYGLPNCLRITVGLEEENRALAEALKDFIAR
jgi:histidinol-phosphate aminotransferase